MIYVFTSYLMSTTVKTMIFINLKSELAGILKNAMSVMYTRFFFNLFKKVILCLIPQLSDAILFFKRD